MNDGCWMNRNGMAENKIKLEDNKENDIISRIIV